MAVRIFKHDKDGPAVSGYPDVRGTWVESYAGAVLDTRERNGYSDSDFYARVWDEETGTVKDVEYATTRGWTYLNSAAVDATDEVKAKAAAYYAKVAFEALKAKAAADARKPGVGKTVKVVFGRKVPQGTVGEVFWMGEGGYYGARPKFKNGWSTKGALRVGLKTEAGETFFTAASNVEVLDPEEFLPDLDELKAKAERTGEGYFAASAAGYAGLVYMG